MHRRRGRCLQNVAAFSRRKTVIHAAFHLGELDERFAMRIEQAQIAVTVERPAGNVLGRWKQARAALVDVEAATARCGLAAESEMANPVVVGIGEFPGPEHRIHRVFRSLLLNLWLRILRWRILSL